MRTLNGQVATHLLVDALSTIKLAVEAPCRRATNLVADPKLKFIIDTPVAQKSKISIYYNYAKKQTYVLNFKIVVLQKIYIPIAKRLGLKAMNQKT